MKERHLSQSDYEFLTTLAEAVLFGRSDEEIKEEYGFANASGRMLRISVDSKGLQ